MTAWDDGGGVAERAVTVNTKDVWVRIGLRFPAGNRRTPPGDLVVSGDILPVPPDGEWWVRVEGVFLNEDRESPISREGKFWIGGLDMGSYLVEVFNGARLRHAETIEIDTKQPNSHLAIFIPGEESRR